ncbi:MAG: hypothetical protein AAGN82_17325 [Myxococcota bacterium]
MQAMPTITSRKKLELIVDRAHLRRFIETLERSGVRGYTVLESTSGKGTRGAWLPDRLTDATDRVVVVAVAHPDAADHVLEDLGALFEELPGVAFVSDVQVLRPERF